MNIYLFLSILSIVWQSLFTGGQFSVTTAKGQVYVDMYDLPDFNNAKYPNLNEGDYDLVYEFRVIQRKGADVNVMTYITKDTEWSFPVTHNDITVMCQIFPYGKNQAAGDGSPYLINAKRIKIIDPSGDLKQFME